MYNLLVVDDEFAVVEQIAEGMSWDRYGISRIFSSMNAGGAIEIMQYISIHILICNIGMPGQTGLELLAWLKEYSPRTKVIILTAQATCNYARQALQLGGLDYLLKPVGSGRLVEAVCKAVEVIGKEQEGEAYYQTCPKAHVQWQTQMPRMVERLWQDVIHGRVSPDQTSLDALFSQYGMPVNAASKIRPVLISIEEWRQSLSAREEERVECALRKSAAEMILNRRSGVVIHTGDVNAVLLYDPPREEGGEKLLRDCKAYIQAASRLFHCSLSCYVGKAADISGLPEQIRGLIRQERRNISQFQQVFGPDDLPPGNSPSYQMPDLEEWATLLEGGRKQELARRIEQTVGRMEAEGVTIETVEAFFYKVLGLIYKTLEKKGCGLSAIYTDKEALTNCPLATKSLRHLKQWLLLQLAFKAEQFAELANDRITVAEQVKSYIHHHYRQEIGREDIARHIHLNSGYLSRLFKKETGMTLSDYIIETRMNKARLLLEQSTLKAYEVSEAVGYWNFTHFTKLFKRVMGVTPQQYRRKSINPDEGSG